MPINKVNTRGAVYDFSQWSNSTTGFGYESSYFTNNYTPQFGSAATVIKDTRFTAGLLNYVFMSNPVAFGIYSKIQSLLERSDYCFVGKNEAICKQLKDILTNAGFKKMLFEGILPAFYGTGGGNGIAFVLNNGKTKEIRFEPFIKGGFTRVVVIGDKNREYGDPVEYRVLDENQQTVHTFKPDEVVHLKYSTPNGDSLIGSSPIISLAKLWLTKLEGLTASRSVFTNGLQAAYVVGLDIANMQKIPGMNAEKMEQAKSILTQELQAGIGLENRNRSIVSKFPLTFNKLQMSNVEMETIKLIEITDDQTYICYGVDKAVFDTSKSKYDNADKAFDSLSISLQAKRKIIEEFVQDFVMPQLWEKYDKEKYPFKLSKEVTTEDMLKKELKQKDLGIYLENLVKLNSTGIMVQPTKEKKEELDSLGFDFTGYIDLKPTDHKQIADNFTGETHADKFRAKQAVDLNSDTVDDLPDFTKEIESSRKMSKIKNNLKAKFKKFIANA